MDISAVTESNLPAVRAFLEARIETSLFLLAGLSRFGAELGAHPNSGNYRVVEEHGDIVAVYCPTRRGHLLAQTGGRNDLASDILHAAAGDPSQIHGVVAEWQAAESLWCLLLARPNFRQTYRAKHVVYHVRPDELPPIAGGDGVRALTPDDFDEWDALNNASLAEEGAHALATEPAIRQGAFVRRALAGHSWGAFDGADLVATAVVDECHERVGQVGGFYTRADCRGKGFGRRVMAAVLTDARHRLGLERVILFADEANARVRALYESLGFTASGSFGFLFGA